MQCVLLWAGTHAPSSRLRRQTRNASVAAAAVAAAAAAAAMSRTIMMVQLLEVTVNVNNSWSRYLTGWLHYFF